MKPAPKNGVLITVSNQDFGTSRRINLPANGIISRWVKRNCWRDLKTPPGYEGAGPLGEVGPQRPPETPGWEYVFTDLPQGAVKATPKRIEDE